MNNFKSNPILAQYKSSLKYTAIKKNYNNYVKKALSNISKR